VSEPGHLGVISLATLARERGALNLLADEMSAAQEQAFRCAEIRWKFATVAFRSAPSRRRRP
jgi:hypothetical protein